MRPRERAHCQLHGDRLPFDLVTRSSRLGTTQRNNWREGAGTRGAVARVGGLDEMVTGGSRIGPGLVHPRYEAGEALGSGGQGIVLRVVDREAPRRALVAKVLRESAFGRESIAGEFALLARLRIAGLVRAHDFGRDAESGAPFFVEDFVDGVDACAWIASGDRD